MTLTLAHVATALTGRPPSLPEVALLSVVVDSRQVQDGALFVAFVGQQTDGHRFVPAAFAHGAVAAIVEQPHPAWPVIDCRAGQEAVWPEGVPVQFLVQSSEAALQQVARFWRQQLSALRVVGITGSVGKSSTKDLTHAVLAQRYRTLKSEQNFNSEIGLPLQLLRVDSSTERAVLEMGMYLPGDIGLLCGIAQPQVGVVTNIGTVHLERTGTLAALIAGKREMVEALPADGVAILNRDDPHVWEMRHQTAARVVSVGLGDKAGGADFSADTIQTHGLDGTRFTLCHAGERTPVHLPLPGAHHLYTALFAAAIGQVEGLTRAEIVAGLQSHATPFRFRVLAGPHGSRILDDSYNANPQSVVAALHLLADTSGRKIAVLGDMLELGSDETDGHRRVGRAAAQSADLLIAVGPRARLMAEAALAAGKSADAVFHTPDHTAALTLLRHQIAPGDTILIKASNAVQLHRLSDALTGGL